MVEHVVLCKDYPDLDYTVRSLLNVIPDVRKVESPPTQVVVDLYAPDTTRLRFMTKRYFDQVYHYGFRGKTIGSKLLKRKLDEIKEA